MEFPINVIRWVALAWKEFKVTTITKCFKKAGILHDNLDVLEVSSDNPFLDVDETVSLGSLISTAMGSLVSCSIDQYVNSDDNLQVCVDIECNQCDLCTKVSLIKRFHCIS